MQKLTQNGIKYKTQNYKTLKKQEKSLESETRQRVLRPDKKNNSKNFFKKR